MMDFLHGLSVLEVEEELVELDPDTVRNPRVALPVPRPELRRHTLATPFLRRPGLTSSDSDTNTDSDTDSDASDTRNLADHRRVLPRPDRSVPAPPLARPFGDTSIPRSTSTDTASTQPDSTADLPIDDDVLFPVPIAFPVPDRLMRGRPSPGALRGRGGSVTRTVPVPIPQREPPPTRAPNVSYSPNELRRIPARWSDDFPNACRGLWSARRTASAHWDLTSMRGSDVAARNPTGPPRRAEPSGEKPRKEARREVL